MRRPTNRLLFSQKAVEKIPVPESGRVHYYDVRVRDLGLRVEASGRKSFFWFRKVRGRPTFRSIGVFGPTSVEQARGKAHELSGTLDKLKRNDYEGKDPFDRRPGEPTLGALLEDYIAKRIKQHTKCPERAEANARWLFDRYLSHWQGRKLGVIRRKEDVRALHAEIGQEHGHVSANRVIQLLRAMYNFALREDWQGENPAKGITRFYEPPRERFLEPNEAPRFFEALKSEQHRDLADFILLALTTGARRGNLFAMRWDELDLMRACWTIPQAKTKSRKTYVLPLVDQAIEVLKARRRRIDGEWVFPGRTGHLTTLKKPWARFRKRAGVPDMRVHDLRRSCGSWAAGAGISLPLIGRLLGHASPSATAVYAKLDLSAVRAAAKLAAGTLFAAAEPKLLKRAGGE